MLTAMRAVDNLVKGTEHDIWAVNAESVYHETEEPGRAAALHRGSGDRGSEGAARTAELTPSTAVPAGSRLLSQCR